MTKVFLLMWLSDIAGAFTVLGAITTLVLTFGLLIATFSLVLERKTGMLKAWLKALTFLGPVALVCGLAPSPHTIQLLAVAEATEVAASTQLGSKALTHLMRCLTR